MVKGIDISHWQGKVEWAKVPAEFVVLKASGGDNGLYKDPMYENYKAGVRTAKKLLLNYHFAGGTDPVKEADFFLSCVGEILEGEGLALDFEGAAVQIKDPILFCEKFVQHIHDTVGFWPLVYSYSSFIKTVQSKLLLNCGLWIADPSTQPRIGNWKVWAMWQYSQAAKGTYSGIGEAVDLDYFNGTIEQLRQYGKPAAPTQVSPTVIAADETFHRYGHVQDIFVKLGQTVTRGQKIATVGTGNGQWSAHCHYDIPKELLALWTDYVFGMSREQVNALYADPTENIKTVMPDFDHYGWRYLELADYGGKTCYHPGVDLNGPGAGNADLGDALYSACNGKVVFLYDGPNANGGWGKLLIVKETVPEAVPTIEEPAQPAPVVVEPVEANTNNSPVSPDTSKGIWALLKYFWNVIFKK